MSQTDKNWLLRTRLKTRQLLLLVALDDERNIHRASDLLNMTQPAASKQLKDLEDTLGVILFERHARGMTPTVYGDAMIRHARVVVTSMSQAQDDLYALKSGLSGKVNVGVIMSPAITTVSTAIALAKAQAPMLCIGVQTENSNILIDRLLHGDLDFLVARVLDHEDRANLQFEEMAQESVCVVARVGHPLLDRKNLTVADVASEGWVLPPQGTILRHRFEMAFRRCGLMAPTNVIETTSALVVTSILQQTDFLHVMPVDVANYCARFNMLRIVPIELDCTMDTFGLITKSGQTLSPGAHILMQTIREVAAAAYPTARDLPLERIALTA